MSIKPTKNTILLLEAQARGMRMIAVEDYLAGKTTQLKGSERLKRAEEIEARVKELKEQHGWK